MVRIHSGSQKKIKIMEDVFEEIHFEFVDSDDFIYFIKLLVELEQIDN